MPVFPGALGAGPRTMPLRSGVLSELKYNSLRPRRLGKATKDVWSGTFSGTRLLELSCRPQTRILFEVVQTDADPRFAAHFPENGPRNLSKLLQSDQPDSGTGCTLVHASPSFTNQVAQLASLEVTSYGLHRSS